MRALRSQRVASLTLAVLLPCGSAWGQGIGPLPQAPSVGPGATQAAEAPAFGPGERKVLDLLRGLRSPERPSDEELAGTLAPLAAPTLGLLFDVLAARSVPAHDGAQPQRLSEIQENVILLALERLDRSRIGAFVGARLAPTEERPEPSADERRAAVAFLGAVGKANDFPELFRLVAAPEGAALAADMESAFRRAARTVMQHDRRSAEQLISLRRQLPEGLLTSLILATGEAREVHGLRFLSEVAYWHEELIQLVMAQVRLLGPSGDPAIDDALRSRLRPYLDPAQPGPCRAAVLALTALKDRDAIAPMIALLTCDSSGIAEGALWGLRQITGLKLSSPESWSRWFQAEQVWLLRRRPAEFSRLQSNDPGEAADALRVIWTHPLAHDELRTALPELLSSRWPAIRALACRTLADLKATAAVPRLVLALEDRTPEVASCAYSALKALTGLDLPQDPELWREATGADAGNAAP